MSTLTPNYSLVKPDPTEVADVAVVNGNMNIVDTELKSRKIEAVTAHSRLRYSGTTWIHDAFDTVGTEYVRPANTTEELISILDQDLLDLAPSSVKKFTVYFYFEARRDSGAGDALFDMQVFNNTNGAAPGGSLITYCKRDEGVGFSSLVDERAFDTATETLVGFGKVSSTTYRVHEFLFAALPTDPSDQISIDIEIKTGAVPLRIRNLQSRVTVEW